VTGDEQPARHARPQRRRRGRESPGRRWTNLQVISAGR
jgi:hypothetical protein